MRNLQWSFWIVFQNALSRILIYFARPAPALRRGGMRTASVSVNMGIDINLGGGGKSPKRFGDAASQAGSDAGM